MKKKYSNHSSEMRTIFFTDGTAVFMFRGQSIETDKEVVSIPDGVRVKDVDAKKKQSTKKVSEEKQEPDTIETDNS